MFGLLPERVSSELNLFSDVIIFLPITNGGVVNIPFKYNSLI